MKILPHFMVKFTIFTSVIHVNCVHLQGEKMCGGCPSLIQVVITLHPVAEVDW